MTPHFAHPPLAVERVGTVTVVTFTEPVLDSEEVTRSIRDHLSALLNQAEYPRLVLDFGRVTYFSGAMIARLISLHKQAEALGGGLALCGLSPNLDDFFRTTQLNKFFALYPDQQAALKAW